ncbi:MAG: ribonuclease III [Synergistaceae bacterium]|jgi:ribonuclease-3|nr:ribonuclease III [Synergistaceae bacterium]
MTGSAASQGKRAFEECLGYSFKRPELLEEALTHSSYANETGIPSCNERLEYLGDAVLELCVSEILFKNHTDYSEGELTRARTSVVSEPPLALWALEAGIPPLLRVGKGLDRQGGRSNPSILADAMEAALGAVFLDGGYEAAREVVLGLMTASGEPIPERRRDSKSRLQERVQAKWELPPVYRVVGRSGPDHAVSFNVEVNLPDGRFLASGVGPSIKAASFAAAESALSALSGIEDEG